MKLNIKVNPDNTKFGDFNERIYEREQRVFWTWLAEQYDCDLVNWNGLVSAIFADKQSRQKIDVNTALRNAMFKHCIPDMWSFVLKCRSEGVMIKNISKLSGFDHADIRKELGVR